MFAWLTDLFRRKPPSGEEFSLTLYKPLERVIYEYFDGEKIIKADPMVLHKRVHEKGSDLAGDLKEAQSQLKTNVQGHDKAVKKIREAFRLKPFEEGGLTEYEVLELLDHYLVFEMVQKKTARTPATSQAATSSTTPPSSEGSQTTPSTSGSGSAATESSTGTPTPSPSGPASPSESSNPDTTTSPQSPTPNSKPS